MKVTIVSTRTSIGPSRSKQHGRMEDVRDVVDEALEAWLDAAEAHEDRESAVAALAEYRRDGGESAESVFGSLAAETQATYGRDERA